MCPPHPDHQFGWITVIRNKKEEMRRAFRREAVKATGEPALRKVHQIAATPAEGMRQQKLSD
jgi:hypothetical protein